MKTEWDYTTLANAYLRRPNYSSAAIDAMLSVMKINDGEVCDVGAGVAHLTLELLNRNFKVVAVEPNDAMRENGIVRTGSYKNISWHEGTGEATGQNAEQFDLVTFGSSFNVCNRGRALEESNRILKKGGWFACMWNHRDLTDDIQQKIESIISSHVPNYNYGSRREDQTNAIDESGLFNKVIVISSSITHEQPVRECIEAWSYHATLARQAGKEFANVVNEIADFLNSSGKDIVNIPYSTKIWIAQTKKN